MAKPLNAPPNDPLMQVPTPEGGTRDQNAPMTKAEQALKMWRDYMGDEPMPPHLRKMYGLPLDNNQTQAR